MTDIFLRLLNMSIAASWLALAVILIRLFFKNMPKWIGCFLWSLLALRLIFPIHFESALSLIPSAEVIPQNITTTATPAIYSGIPAINSTVNPRFVEASSKMTPDTLISYGSKIWLLGLCLMLIYCFITYFKLYKVVRVSLNYKDNVYICDNVKSPFLLGIIRPRIYLPSDIDEESAEYILMHENAHIKRRDHWWKPLGFLLLCIYWYNPILWLAYSMLCRDIESACDEKVISTMDNGGKALYSAILANCSIHPKFITICPVAFGETGVKTRIKGILNYKKPALWLVLTSVLVCAVIAVCFLTNPLSCLHNYESEITQAATCTHEGVAWLTCTECQHGYAAHIDIIDHSYEHRTTSKPTCTHEGTELFTCTICGIQHTETLALLPHTPTGEVFITASNCTEHGQKSIACTECGTICSTEILPINDDHDLHETVIREATCDLAGEGIISCSRCDYSVSCTYPQLEHNYVTKIEIQPRCLISGYSSTYCTLCGHSFTTELPQTWHNFVPIGNGYERCTDCGLRKSTSSSSPLFGNNTSSNSGIPTFPWDSPNKP